MMLIKIFYITFGKVFKHKEKNMVTLSKIIDGVEMLDQDITEYYKRRSEAIQNSCPWLKTCLRRMDVTNIGDLHELTDIIIKKELV